MFNIDIKNRLLEILNCILELHNELLSKLSSDVLFIILQDCQNAAISVGETLEKDIDRTEPIVHLLESYCEEIFLITQDFSITSEKIIRLDKQIKEVIDFVENLKCKYQIVFFPYKASMWDSLESIWIACREDERCDCMVVPIPYYKFDMQKGSAQFCYEIAEFPDYVPVINYQNYDIHIECPDIAYVHNPYDNCNYVTSIHPDYYSKEIKKHVKKLVYVPYYVTEGQVSEHHKYLPIYTNMDYMIAQSETFKRGFERLPYYHKILVFGSPKFDKVLQKSNKLDSIPDMWKNILKGKKAVMLNTSINCFLSDGELMLKKLKIVIQSFEKKKHVVLIWRPHPLMEATILSMRPQLKDPYNELINYFNQNQVGILDRTPDITNTVAIADAYIGESSSSVVHLFEVAGKPVFILDNFIIENYSEEEKRRIIIADIANTENGTWLIPQHYNGLFKVENDSWKNINFITRFQKQPKWACTYIMTLEKAGRVYLSPYDATSVVSIDIESNEIETINSQYNKNMTSKVLVEYNDCLYFVLNYQDAILQYNTKTKKWIRHSNIFKDLTELPNEKKVANMWSCAMYKELLWITATHSNKILQFNMMNGKINIVQFSAEAETYSAIACDAVYTYVAECHTGNIIYLNRLNGDKGIYKMPKEFFVQETKDSTSIAHLKLIITEKYIITIPCVGNCMVKINKQTGDSTLLIESFWSPSTKIHNGYAPHTHGKTYFAKQIDTNNIFVQRLYDGALAKVNIETEQYEIQYPMMDKESYKRFMHQQDGFEKLDDKNSFVCRESKFFSLDEFLNKLTSQQFEDIQKRQLKALSSMAANLDGTCGKKVHEYMINILEKENVNENSTIYLNN